jgi:hypothetical protein
VAGSVNEFVWGYYVYLYVQLYGWCLRVHVSDGIFSSPLVFYLLNLPQLKVHGVLMILILLSHVLLSRKGFEHSLPSYDRRVT